MTRWTAAPRWFGGLLLSVLGLPEVAGSASPFPIEFTLEPDAVLALRFATEPDAYEVLFAGDTPSTISRPIAVAVGAGRSLLFRVPLGGERGARFFRVQRVPLETPLDVDGDGLDDVYELRRAPALDPLDPGDGGSDPDGDAATAAQEYLLGTDPLSADRWQLAAAPALGDAPLLPWDLSFQIVVERAGFRFRRATGRFVQTITVRNRGPRALAGPVELLLGDLSPGTTLFNSDGSVFSPGPADQPYLSVRLGPGDVLPPGATATVEVEFTHPSQAGIRYASRAVRLLPGDAADEDADGTPDAWEAMNGYATTRRDSPAAELSSGPMERD